MMHPLPIRALNLFNLCRRFGFLWLLLGSISPAYAVLTINITQGVSQKVPVAVVPISGSNPITKDLPDGMNLVIIDDLKNSGRFSVDSDNLPALPKSSDSIDWARWPVDYILSLHVQKNGNSYYDIRFEIMQKSSRRIVNARVFQNVEAKNLREVAHNIANYLYETATGSKGYFNSKIAYIDVSNPYDLNKAHYRLIISDYDGFNPHVLLSQTKNPLASPDWSKDGNYIAYVSYDKGSMAIYTIDIYSGKIKKIAHFSGINSAPAFSPDGQTMAMALSQGYSENTDIYLMNLKNDQLYKKLSLNGINTAPTFSPDGRQLAFVSDRNGRPQLYITDIDAKYPASQLIETGAYQAFDPQFTPDGKTIVFMYQRQRGSGTQIAKVDLLSHRLTILTQGEMDSSPSVSADGNMIIYSKGGSNGEAELAMVSIDGNVQITLPSTTNGSVQSPAWA